MIGAGSPWDRNLAPIAHMNACHPQTVDTSQWRWHNCSCGMRVMEKFIQYHTRIEATPADIPWNTSWRPISSIPLLTEDASISRWSSPHDGVLNIHNGNLLAQDNPHAVCWRGCDDLYNVGIWALMISDIALGPCLLPDRQIAQWCLDFLETVATC
jgi:hypothetical protein